MSLPGKLLICTAILETILLQQVSGRSADKRGNEKTLLKSTDMKQDEE
jgi:hypothetical protein